MTARRRCDNCQTRRTAATVTWASVWPEDCKRDRPIQSYVCKPCLEEWLAAEPDLTWSMYVPRMYFRLDGRAIYL